MRGRERRDPHEGRHRVEEVFKEQKVRAGLRVQLTGEAWQREERLDLRREGDATPIGGDEERLLSKAIAREDQRALMWDPQRAREHPLDAFEDLFAPLQISPQEHLGVSA